MNQPMFIKQIASRALRRDSLSEFSDLTKFAWNTEKVTANRELKWFKSCHLVDRFGKPNVPYLDLNLL